MVTICGYKLVLSVTVWGVGHVGGPKQSLETGEHRAASVEERYLASHDDPCGCRPFGDDSPHACGYVTIKTVACMSALAEVAALEKANLRQALPFAYDRGPL